MKAQSLFPLLLFLLLLTACGGSPPLTRSDIPLLPGARPLEPGENAEAELTARSMEEFLMGDALQGSVVAYRLPTQSSWEEIRAFYATELAKDAWRESLDMSGGSEELSTKTAGWTRGSLNQEQALLLSLSSDSATGETFLLVGLFSE